MQQGVERSQEHARGGTLVGARARWNADRLSSCHPMPCFWGRGRARRSAAEVPKQFRAVSSIPTGLHCS
eukprot:15448081-Alexandrium_andersonii.AAC.1